MDADIWRVLCFALLYFALLRSAQPPRTSTYNMTAEWEEEEKNNYSSSILAPFLSFPFLIPKV